MLSRLVPFTVCLAMGALLAACGHHNDRWGGQTAVYVGADAPPPVEHEDGPALHAWSAPTVIPVALQGPQAVADTDGPYLLDTGDRLRVFVYGQPNLSRLYTVDHGGWITVPLIGGVRTRGLTTFELERKLKAKLGAQYVKDPHVTVDVQQNRPFFILGEVRTAGQYPYVSGMTVKTAVAIAGGFSERANERKFQVTRRINGLIEKLDVPDDYVVLPGDTIQVYERFF
jgi:polysaccharide export outer membrane protein